jgi:hypothetical protein
MLSLADFSVFASENEKFKFRDANLASFDPELPFPLDEVI